MSKPERIVVNQNNFVDALAQQLFGRKCSSAIYADLCVCCGKEVGEFSRKADEDEYKISGICSRCQHKFFDDPINLKEDR
jgi:hypothetical protein